MFRFAQTIGGNAITIIGNNFQRLNCLQLKYPTVILKKCPVIDETEGHRPLFEGTTTVFMDDCESSFVHQNLKRHIFPDIKQIYLKSPPGGHMTFFRFREIEIDDIFDPVTKPSTPIYLHQKYADYKEQWGKHGTMNNTKVMDNIQIITDEKYKAELQKLTHNGHDAIVNWTESNHEGMYGMFNDELHTVCMIKNDPQFGDHLEFEPYYLNSPEIVDKIRENLENDTF